MGSNRVLVSIDGGTHQSSPILSAHNLLSTMNPIYVNQAGDKMEGNLDMKNYKITNISDPIDNKDVVNKQYVDKVKTEIKEYVNKILNEQKQWSFGFILDIGNSDKSFKVTKCTIPLSIIKELSNKLNLTTLKPFQFNIQLTAAIMDHYHDEITMNIQDYKIIVDRIEITVNTYRTTNTGWGAHVYGHLLITVYDKEQSIFLK